MTLRLPAGLVAPTAVPASVADILPAVLAPLGVPGLTPAPGFTLPSAERTVVFVVDGLGIELLLDHEDEAPFLNSLWLDSSWDADSPGVAAAFPTSTAVSVTSIGTGLDSGEHGLVGYTMFVPEAGAVLECLSWREYGGGPDLLRRAVPEQLQPWPTLAERANAAGIAFTLVTYAPHEGSGLTRAAHRGARFLGIPWDEDLDRRVGLLSNVSSEDGPLVISTYYAGLDMAGHQYGVDSGQWRSQLRTVDGLTSRIADSLPSGTRVIVTADHGMVDLLPGERGRIDLATRPGLARGLTHFAGDPRMRHLHTEPGETERVADRWRTELGEDVWILPREDAIDAGFFGPTVRPEVVGRIGDLLALSVAEVGMFDSRVAPNEVPLVGHHGSLTSRELLVPALVLTR